MVLRKITLSTLALTLLLSVGAYGLPASNSPASKSATIPARSNQLKELDWLVGDWEDKDENVSLTSTNAWDKDKNFLTQKFVLQVQGQPELTGYQIMGWDPIKKEIRSWIFDSDGGFGHGIWAKEGNSWYARIGYTRPDGKKASSTQIYTPVDGDTYTFAAVGREVAGELLPNLDPVKVTRKR